MGSQRLYDWLIRLTGLLVLAGLTSALFFAFREQLLPYQQEGDVFETVYAIRSDEEEEEEAASEDENETIFEGETS